MSKEFLKSDRNISEILPVSPTEDKVAEIAKYSRLLEEQQRGFQRAVSKGDRKSADKIQGAIRNLQDKYDKARGQLRHVPEEKF